MPPGPVISLSPSFNSYSNVKLAEIAARVAQEFDSDEFYEQVYFETDAARQEEVSDEEYEFAFVTTDTSKLPSPVSADEIFQNGQIRPVYPLFNRDLMHGYAKVQKENSVKDSESSNDKKSNRLPLRKLFTEERESALTTSCSDDELDGVPAESYCVWRPKEAEACKKSNSTGSNSKRWKFKDLLHRSHSDGGKDTFVFLTHSNNGRKKETLEGRESGATKSPPYTRDGGEKHRSYLPYKQDLVGFFGNGNGVNKNLQPF